MHEIFIHILEALLAKLIAWQVERIYESLSDKSKCAVCKYDKNGIRLLNHKISSSGDDGTALCCDCTEDFSRLLNKKPAMLPRVLRQPDSQKQKH